MTDVRRACMVVHNWYPADPRVRRQAEALIAAGWSVDVVCIRGRGEPSAEVCGGARVHRLPVRRHRTGGMRTYLSEYLTFFALAAVWVAQLDRERRFDVVQAHNMPDFLVFTALVPRLRGGRAVLDIHDPVPELFATKFGVEPSHPVVQITRVAERASTAFADHVFTVGEPSRRALVGRGTPRSKVTLVVNSADPRIFAPRPEAPRRDDPLTLLYHGGIFERYGLDVAVRAVDRLRERISGLRFRIFGDGEAAEGLRRLIRELGLRDRVELHHEVPHEQVAALIADADLGVVPYRRSAFTDLLYPTKAFEYMAVGIPLVMSRLAGVLELFGEVPDMFVEPGDVDALAERIATLHDDRARLSRLAAAARAAYAPHDWESQRRRYLDTMEQLANR